jgi:peptidyl-dipeptidase A
VGSGEAALCALHAHVRARLAEVDGKDKVPADGPIPAHLLGNMWAQDWTNIYPLVKAATGGQAYDLTALLRERDVDARGLVRIGERFCTSLGFEPLPETFWERSLFVKPRDRDVVCHASAWDVDNDEDLRLKMCIRGDAEDFLTVHHELGHNFHQRAYRHQPFLFRDSANDGFHEAIGDTIALSVTPGYLVKIGPAVPGALGRERHRLSAQARSRQGRVPPVRAPDRPVALEGLLRRDPPRPLRRGVVGAAAEVPGRRLDPGAKYHVPAYVPYSRYFLADILQFQFHRALCREAGFEGPLYQCSIYGNRKAGEKLRRMLAMGRSRPWPDELGALTGQRQVDASALGEYFQPLMGWLREQNRGRKVGY